MSIILFLQHYHSFFRKKLKKKHLLMLKNFNAIAILFSASQLLNWRHHCKNEVLVF